MEGIAVFIRIALAIWTIFGIVKLYDRFKPSLKNALSFCITCIRRAKIIDAEVTYIDPKTGEERHGTIFAFQMRGEKYAVVPYSNPLRPVPVVYVPPEAVHFVAEKKAS